VTNLIQIKPTATPAAVKREIENAFQRNAAIHASHVAVEEAGGAVTRVGLISSWAERDEAECADWPAPGVTSANDQVTIRFRTEPRRRLIARRRLVRSLFSRSRQMTKAKQVTAPAE